MAKAKKLPSGQWRTLVYSHTEKVDGKDKRIYESFTAENKPESEYMAAEFVLNRKRKSKPQNLTLGEAIDKYIAESRATLSPTTIQNYEKIRKYSFEEIMDTKIKDITNEVLQNSVNIEINRPSAKSKNPKKLSPKTKLQYGTHPPVVKRA